MVADSKLPNEDIIGYNIIIAQNNDGNLITAIYLHRWQDHLILLLPCKLDLNMTL